MSYGITDEQKFYSHELEEELDVIIYLPPQYTPFHEYPICIAQDGKDYFQLGRVVRILDELINDGEIEPIIFVGIPYKNVSDRREKYHPTGAKQKHYINFLTKELLPFLEQHFPVAKTAENRALAGDSLAATVSLYTAIQYPEIFGKVMLHSPYVDQDVFQMIENYTKWERLTIYHVIGRKETAVKMTDGEVADFLSMNRKLSQVLQQKKLSYFYNEFDGDHTWKYWQKDLKRAFCTLFSE